MEIKRETDRQTDRQRERDREVPLSNWFDIIPTGILRFYFLKLLIKEAQLHTCGKHTVSNIVPKLAVLKVRLEMSMENKLI
jgi:hypothetical protein